jgi:hypothetical protein
MVDYNLDLIDYNLDLIRLLVTEMFEVFDCLKLGQVYMKR